MCHCPAQKAEAPAVWMQLALKASQLLEQTKLSELRSNIARSLSELEMFTEDGGEGHPGRRRSAMEERIEALVDAPLPVEDALVALFDHTDHTLQRRVIETYIRRLYQVQFSYLSVVNIVNFETNSDWFASL